MSILIISCSLNPNSRSRILANAIKSKISEDFSPEIIDMRDFPLPFCNGNYNEEDKNTQTLKNKIEKAKAIAITTPIYNYSANAVLKNLIEQTGSAWNEKPVGFACSAGGGSSYMAILTEANSLMLDFRCLIIPRFVYATRNDFQNEEVTNPNIKERLTQLSNQLIKFSKF